MRPSDNVIDFTLARKRRQARKMAEMMWTLYANRAGLTAFQAMHATQSSETQRA